VIILEARPVYQYVGQHLLHTEPSIMGLVVGFGGATLLCLAATFIPIRIAVRRMKELER
jgi:ABC-type lipoprotein release transport system permease subunit